MNHAWGGIAQIMARGARYRKGLLKVL